MKQIFTIFVIIFAMGCFTIGQTRSKQNESDEKIVLQIERELSAALTESNNYPFEKHLSEEFVFFQPFGDVLNKSQMIAIVKGTSLRIESSKCADYKIQINGRTAIVVYRSSDVGFFKFVEISGRFEWVDVFEKRSGNWQLVYKRGTAIRSLIL